MKRLLLLCFLLVVYLAKAQETFPETEIADKRPGIYALTNATIFVDYQTKIEKGILVVKDGKVLACGSDVSIPKGAIVIDMANKYIYPAVVEPYANYGLPSVESKRGRSPQYDSKLEGPYGWNDAIKSTYASVTEFSANAEKATEFRKAGIGSMNTFRADGLMRGTSLFVALSGLPVQESVLSEEAAAHFSFDKGSSTQNYPNSIMGMVALLRQTYLDAQWYANGGEKEQVNLSLAAFNKVQPLPQIFEANGDKLRVLLADKIGDEFGVQYIIKGNGDEYQRLNEIKATGAPLIIPVNFPEAYDVDDPYAALEISLADMKHWEMAPSNGKRLADAGIEFAFTTSGLKDPGSYWDMLRKTATYGLSESQVLKAVTYTPASYLKMQSEVGALKKGMLANFFVASGNIFDDKTKIQQTWVQGQQFEFGELNPKDYAGKYELKANGKSFTMEISGEPESPKAKLVLSDTSDIKVDVSIRENRITLIYKDESLKGDVRLTGWITETGFAGTGMVPGADWKSWTAVKTGALDKKKEEEKKEENTPKAPEMGDMIYPFVAFGWSEQPKQETILFKNATVWTMEADGKLEGADVLVKDGKIVQVGKGLSASGARVVDATGKHLTPGIIDEHSHIALTSVNEGSQAVTAEVRMYDALNSEDIEIYRQLAGGVVVSQLLHGSANPVGGQSALVKFRWGSSPDGMKIQGADPFIKFALGENVKQSNWGEEFSTRYPQTRMGVEQVYMDGFTRAKEYGVQWAKYEGLSKKVKANTPAPRRDLQLEALLEIINGERFITCHSYVQSEINMMMKVSDQFNFRINTFTHILEGYKVADKMKEHGIGGGTFGDWWAYKFEVNEAIPYNATLMSMVGVTTAINSDDAEMARRLNQEAAKSMKYGGMDEISAMKMVTINPAKLLHLDDRMGSIKVGKDADLVLWSDYPLSIYAKPEITMVDGTVYFSREKDAERREYVAKERSRLIQKMRDAKDSGAKTQKPGKKEKHYFDCEDIIIEQ